MIREGYDTIASVATCPFYAMVSQAESKKKGARPAYHIFI